MRLGGLLSAYFGWLLDAAIMSVADVQLSLPYLILAISMMALLGPSLPLPVVVLAVRGWVNYARTIGAVAEGGGVRHRGGGGGRQPAADHPAPPAAERHGADHRPQFLRGGGDDVDRGIAELPRVGGQTPGAELGQHDLPGSRLHLPHWWMPTLPGVALMLAVLGANQLGDGLRDLLDPRLRGTRL